MSYLWAYFCSGEIEIILLDKTPVVEKQRRLELLLNTCYRSEFTEWERLLHLHRSILSRLEKGTADWTSSFDDIEHQVLTVMGAVSKKKLMGDKSDAKASSLKKSKKPLTSKDSTSGLLYCSKFQTNECNEQDPHTVSLNGVQREVFHVCASCLKQGKSEKHGRVSCPAGSRA